MGNIQVTRAPKNPIEKYRSCQLSLERCVYHTPDDKLIDVYRAVYENYRDYHAADRYVTELMYMNRLSNFWYSIQAKDVEEVLRILFVTRKDGETVKKAVDHIDENESLMFVSSLMHRFSLEIDDNMIFRLLRDTIQIDGKKPCTSILQLLHALKRLRIGNDLLNLMIQPNAYSLRDFALLNGLVSDRTLIDVAMENDDINYLLQAKIDKLWPSNLDCQDVIIRVLTNCILTGKRASSIKYQSLRILVATWVVNLSFNDNYLLRNIIKLDSSVLSPHINELSKIGLKIGEDMLWEVCFSEEKMLMLRKAGTAVPNGFSVRNGRHVYAGTDIVYPGTISSGAELFD